MLLCALIFAVSCFAVEPLDAVLRETGMRAPRHGVYVVAHRGAHEGIPENTLAAYRKAIELGCDFIEVDVRATKDGVLVSVHDAKVDAYTDSAKGPVRDFTLAELKALDIGSRIGSEWKDERVPTMDEVFELCKGKIGLYLDVKDPAVIPQLLEMVRKYGMERDALWYTGVPQQLAVQKECPECLVMPDPGPEKMLAGMLEKFDVKPRIVASVMRFCSKEFIDYAHNQGAIVIVDEGSPDDWSTMIEFGMDGIQTDHPERLIEFLKSR